MNEKRNKENIPNRKILPTVLNFMDGSRPMLKTNANSKKSTTDIFDLLRRAVNERRRIEVLTRDCRSICGILIGWLIAFDKHMNLIMSDVDEVFRRLTDGQDYLELGPKDRKMTSTPFEKSNTKITEVTNDFQTFRNQLANFLRNKRKQPVVAKASTHIPTNENDDDDENDDECQQGTCECHPEEFLPMELLSINNLTVQRLSGKTSTNDCSSSSSLQVQSLLPTSKRAKVRFFSRHIPKIFIKGNQVCLIRLVPS